MSKVTSIRLNDTTAAQLDELAAALDRPRAWVIEQAIQRYVDEEAWQVLAIKEALAEYRSGKAALIPHSEVEARIEEMGRAKAGDESSLA